MIFSNFEQTKEQTDNYEYEDDATWPVSGSESSLYNKTNGRKTVKDTQINTDDV